MLQFIKTVLLFLIVFNNCFGVDIGKFLKVCNRYSADVNDCLVNAVQNGISVMAGGIEELGVPAIDPYHQKLLKVDYKNNQINVKMVMKDIYVEGLKASKVHDVRLRADEDRFDLEIDLTTPKMFIYGQYHGEGRYNSLKIDAEGNFNTTMTNLVFTWKLGGKPETTESGTFVRIESFYMRPDVGNMVSYLSNDNPDTKELTDLGNRFTNANWRTLYKELLPYAQENWNKIGIRVANKIFLKEPYDELFPTTS